MKNCYWMILFGNFKGTIREIHKNNCPLLYCPFENCSDRIPERFETKLATHFLQDHKNNFTNRKHALNFIRIMKKLSIKKVETKKNYFVSIEEINNNSNINFEKNLNMGDKLNFINNNTPNSNDINNNNNLNNNINNI
jgi:hypothetical protein